MVAQAQGTQLAVSDARAGCVSRGRRLVASVSASQAQVELKTYMDDKGYLNVRALTCAQLANTFQEDADFLGAWYSGWWNGHAKRHSINVARAKAGHPRSHRLLQSQSGRQSRRRGRRLREEGAEPAVISRILRRA